MNENTHVIGVIPGSNAILSINKSTFIVESNNQLTTGVISLSGGQAGYAYYFVFDVNPVTNPAVSIGTNPTPCKLSSGGNEECVLTFNANFAESGIYMVNVDYILDASIVNATSNTPSFGVFESAFSFVISNGSAPSNAKAITSFSLDGTNGLINGTNIAVSMPFGTDVTSLVATFTTTGEFVTIGSTLQVDGMTANDFTNNVVYTVHAADSSTQDYNVTVTVESSGAKEITSFSLDGTSGLINGTNITVNMPFGTDVTNLVATFTTTGELVTIGSTLQVSGVTTNDFTNPVTYTVHAADDSTQEYSVIVTVESSDAKEIISFSLDGTNGLINGTNITVNMPFGTDITNLVATFTTTGELVTIGSTLQVSGVTANDFTNPVTYTVYAADGSTQNYIVIVTIAGRLEISGFSESEMEIGESANLVISLSGSYGISDLSVMINSSDSNILSVTPEGCELNINNNFSCLANINADSLGTAYIAVSAESYQTVDSNEITVISLRKKIYISPLTAGDFNDVAVDICNESTNGSMPVGDGSYMAAVYDTSPFITGETYKLYAIGSTESSAANWVAPADDYLAIFEPLPSSAIAVLNAGGASVPYWVGQSGSDCQGWITADDQSAGLGSVYDAFGNSAGTANRICGTETAHVICVEQ